MHKLRNLKSIPRTTMLWQACARSIASGRGIHIRPVIPLKYTSMVSSVHRKRSTSSWGGSWYMAHVQGSVDRYFNNSKHDIQDHITNKPRNSHWLVPETLHRGATGKQQLCQTLCLQLVQIMPWCIEKKTLLQPPRCGCSCNLWQYNPFNCTWHVLLHHFDKERFDLEGLFQVKLQYTRGFLEPMRLPLHVRNNDCNYILTIPQRKLCSDMCLQTGNCFLHWKKCWYAFAMLSSCVVPPNHLNLHAIITWALSLQAQIINFA